MRILHLTNTLAAGGAELQLLTLCKELKQRGFELHVGYLRERGTSSRSLMPEFEQAGVAVTYLGGESLYGVSSIRAARRLLKELRPDVLHTHLPRADFIGMLASAFGPVPWVASVHNVYNHYWRGHRLLPILGRVWSRADATVAISAAVKDWLVHQRGVSRSRIEVVRYGIDLQRFERPARDLRREWLLGHAPVIGCLARIEPRKGQDCLIRALPMILRSVPNAILLLAGHGDPQYAAQLKDLAAQLGVAARVRFVGFQDDPASFLHAIDVFALATHSEGFGQVFIEAMAAGRPVVTTAAPPMTEIVVHGETGFLVDPCTPQAFGPVIAALLNHPVYVRLMGEQGRQRAFQEFSVTRMVYEMMAVYHTVRRQCATDVCSEIPV